jgi:hypothetical protein
LDGIPLLSIQIGKENLTASLSRYNPIPMEVDATRSEVDPCIFKGRLTDEPKSEVLVTGGCPGSDTFEVIFICTKPPPKIC